MRHIDSETLSTCLPWPDLVDRMFGMFSLACVVPDRLHYSVGRADMQERPTMLLMPAWTADYLGVKIVNVFPGNAAHDRPALTATYQLFSNRTGELLALIDGDQLTARRTAATSVAAARVLSDPQASRLLVVGAGRVASLLAPAYRCARPIEQVVVWDINRALASSLVGRLCDLGFAATLADDLDQAVRDADIVTAATLSSTPLILGDQVQPGTHVDLIGGFRTHMREADDALIGKATVFVDTANACTEAGDLADPIRRGVIHPSSVVDLPAVALGRHPGRRRADEITLFKSVGSALADLAAASLAYERVTK